MAEGLLINELEAKARALNDYKGKIEDLRVRIQTLRSCTQDLLPLCSLSLFSSTIMKGLPSASVVKLVL